MLAHLDGFGMAMLSLGCWLLFSRLKVLYFFVTFVDPRGLILLVDFGFLQQELVGVIFAHKNWDTPNYCRTSEVMNEVQIGLIND